MNALETVKQIIASYESGDENAAYNLLQAIRGQHFLTNCMRIEVTIDDIVFGCQGWRVVDLPTGARFPIHMIDWDAQ